MKTLADFKRALSVGSKWHTKLMKYGTDIGVRPVSKVRSNGVSFRTVRPNGEVCDSYLDFPKACNVKFREDGTVEIWAEARPELNEPAYCKLTYKKVED